MDNGQLTTEMLQKYVGGQVVIQSYTGDYLCRGPIEKAEVVGEEENEKLIVTFEWLAKYDGQWRKDVRTNSEVFLMGVTVSKGDRGELLLLVSSTSEIMTFFPPDAVGLDRRQVIGLE